MVRHRHKGVLLPKKAPVFADKTQPIHVGIHADAQIALPLRDGLRQIGQVTGQRLRVVREMSCGFAVNRNDLHTQGFEEQGHRHASRRVHGVNRHLQSRATDGLGIHQRQVEDVSDMALQPAVVLGGAARGVHVRVGHPFTRQRQHTVSRRGGQKLALGVQKLEGVPLLGVV